MRPKVLHVVEAIEGGVARHLVNLVEHVDAQHLVALPRERVGGVTDVAAFGAMERAGARLHLLDMRRSPISPLTLAAVPRVHQLIRKARVDVVHGHSSVGGAVARIAAIGTGARRVYTPNGLFPVRAAHVTERALGPLTDRLIASSPSEAKQVRQLRLVPDSRMVVIPNAIDVEPPPPASIDLRAELEVDSATPLVGMVGRLVPQKAPEIFVRACRRVAEVLPDARFVLVGEGPLADDVIAEIAGAGLEDRMLLLRDRPDGERLMSQFDVFALSSRYEAGATFVAMEAMRVGTPVVVTDVVGNRDTVENGTAGIVVPPDDGEALADGIVRLLKDPVLRQHMGQAGRARVVARFDVRQAGATLGALYRALATERSA